MRKIAMYLMGAVMLCVGISSLYAHDPATHMYIESLAPDDWTYNAWRSYDYDFACELNDPEVRKFYYLGLILPDMVDTLSQRAIQILIEKLYEIPFAMPVTWESDFTFWFIRIPFEVSFYLLADPQFGQAVIVNDDTYSLTRELMLFKGNHPNTNLQKMREMVEYAH